MFTAQPHRRKTHAVCAVMSNSHLSHYSGPKCRLQRCIGRSLHDSAYLAGNACLSLARRIQGPLLGRPSVVNLPSGAARYDNARMMSLHAYFIVAAGRAPTRTSLWERCCALCEQRALRTCFLCQPLACTNERSRHLHSSVSL